MSPRHLGAPSSPACFLRRALCCALCAQITSVASILFVLQSHGRSPYRALGPIGHLRQALCQEGIRVTTYHLFNDKREEKLEHTRTTPLPQANTVHNPLRNRHSELYKVVRSSSRVWLGHEDAVHIASHACSK